MNGGGKEPSRPQDASSARIVFHVILAILGWILFAYFWRIVAVVGMSRGARIALIAMAIFVAILLGVTTLWIVHNLRIGRRNRRSKVFAVAEKIYDVDASGFKVEMIDSALLRRSPVIEIDIEGKEKKYRTGPVAGGPGAEKH